ncbi:LINE-1 retrotransposable element ORF2 protein [Linum perenne]
MSLIATTYFQEIFQRGDCQFVDVIPGLETKVTDTDNSILARPFTIQEFKEAVFSTDPNKAPGPNGFNPNFYQAASSRIEEEIFQSSRAWLEEGILPDHLRLANIILIPKVDRPEGMKDLRPISLCSCFIGL